MKYNDSDESNLAKNLIVLRHAHRLSQEKAAESVGVTRQALAKWENGDSLPDIVHCNALASLYDVSLDDLVRFDQKAEQVEGVPPKNKHIFGTVQVGERGQIVIPKKARDLFDIKAGDILVVLGDSNPETAGIALVKGEKFIPMGNYFMRSADGEDGSK